MKFLSEDKLVTAIKQGLDQAIEGVDSQTQAKLTAARLKALEQPRRLSDLFDLTSLPSGFAATAVVTLTVALAVFPQTMDSPIQEGTQLAATPSLLLPGIADTRVDVNVMEVLMSNEDMDFLENLDMYEWMAAEYG